MGLIRVRFGWYARAFGPKFAAMKKVGGLALLLLLVPAAAFAQEQRPPDDETTLKGEPNGLSADVVGKRAAETSYQAKAAEQALRGAAARVDSAWAAFLPRLTTIASYTRLSDLTPPSLGTLIVSTEPPGPITSFTNA